MKYYMQPKQLGIVIFDSDPHGASVYVDGQLLTDPDSGENLRTPGKAILVEGRHDFTISLEGHEDADGYVDILPGTTVNIYRNLKPGKSEEGWGKPQPQIWLKNAQHTGVIKAYSFPDGAEVYVDGRPAMINGQIAKTPVTITNVPAGVRQVSFRMPGQLEEMKLVDVEEGAWSEVSVAMRPISPKLVSSIENLNLEDSRTFGFLDIEDTNDFKML